MTNRVDEDVLGIFWCYRCILARPYENMVDLMRRSARRQEGLVKRWPIVAFEDVL